MKKPIEVFSLIPKNKSMEKNNINMDWEQIK